MSLSSNVPTLIYTALALLTLYYLKKFLVYLYYYIKLRYFFPGPKTLSILGQGLTDFGEKDLQKFESYVEQYPRMHRMVYAHMVRIVVACPELIAQVYSQVPDKDTMFMDLILPLLGNGLITSSGEIWKRNRRLLTPLFHSKCLVSFCEVFNKTGEHFSQILSQYVGKESFEFNQHARLATFEATMNSIWSGNSDLLNNIKGSPKESRYLELLDAMNPILLARFQNPLYFFDLIWYRTSGGKKFLSICKEMRGLMADYLRERRDKQEEESRDYNDLLDLIMKSKDENGNGLTDVDMIDELGTFFIAGFETTTGGLSFLMYCLCRYPEWQVKCREEIREVLGDRDTVEWEDISKFVCLNNCLKESLRMYSPALLVQRVVEEPITLDGYKLHKGAMIDIGIQSVHMNPTVWEDPHKFDPNRFCKENLDTKHPYSFIPFSAGPRNCIGQQFALIEMKILAVKLLKEFEFSLTPGYELIRETKSVLTQKGGLNLVLRELA